MQRKDREKTILRITDKTIVDESREQTREMQRQQSESLFSRHTNLRQVERQFNKFKLTITDSNSQDLNLSVQPKTTTAMNRHQSGKIYNKRQFFLKPASQPLATPRDQELQDILLSKQRQLFRKNKQISQLEQQVHVLTTKIKQLESENLDIHKGIEKVKRKMKENKQTYMIRENQIKSAAKERFMNQLKKIMTIVKSVDFYNAGNGQQIRQSWREVIKSLQKYEHNYRLEKKQYHSFKNIGQIENIPSPTPSSHLEKTKIKLNKPQCITKQINLKQL